MKKGSFYIYCRSDEQGKYAVRKVDGYIDGDYGYHKASKWTWVATHLASGLAVQDRPTRKKCEEFIKQKVDFLAGLCQGDWYQRMLKDFRALVEAAES